MPQPTHSTLRKRQKLKPTRHQEGIKHESISSLFLNIMIDNQNRTLCIALQNKYQIQTKGAPIKKGSHMLFHALLFAGSRGSFLNTRPLGRVFNIIRGTRASSNAMKQTCVIVILAYFTLFQPIRTENPAKTLNCPFSYTGFL